MIRETDEECSLLIATIRDRSNMVGGLYGTNSEVVRLMGNLESRIIENEYMKTNSEKSREHIKMIRDCLLHISSDPLRRMVASVSELANLHRELHLTGGQGDNSLFADIDEFEYQKKEKALAMAVAQVKEQEKASDQVSTRNPKLQTMFDLSRDIDALTYELTLLRSQNDELRKQNDLQKVNDRLCERSPYLSHAVHAEVVREVAERLNPVCKAITQIEQNVHNARTELSTEIAQVLKDARLLSDGAGRAELVKAALDIWGRVDGKLHAAAETFLLKSLESHP